MLYPADPAPDRHGGRPPGFGDRLAAAVLIQALAVAGWIARWW